MADYSPFPLVTDAAAFGLTETTVTGTLGTTVARHLPRRNGARATLFLHGAAGSWTTWTPLLLEARQDGIAIPEPVLFDLPGWGDAVLDQRDGIRTIDTVCELVRDAALQLGYTEWDLVGHSMGGFIALHMAALWSSTVRSVTLVSPTAWSVIASVEHPVRDFGRLPGFTLLWQAMRFLSALGGAGRSIVGGLGRMGVLRPLVAPLFRHPFRIDRTVIDGLSREIRPASFVAAAEIARAYDADEMWATISCPVRALKGDRDVFVRDDDLERLARAVPQVSLEVVAHCGHFATAERPKAVLDLLTR